MKVKSVLLVLAFCCLAPLAAAQDAGGGAPQVSVVAAARGSGLP